MASSENQRLGGTRREVNGPELLRTAAGPEEEERRLETVVGGDGNLFSDRVVAVRVRRPDGGVALATGDRSAGRNSAALGRKGHVQVCGRDADRESFDLRCDRSDGD